MRWPAVFAVLAALAGCGDGAASGPFDGLPLDGDLEGGLSSPAHVARDRYGIAHVFARTIGDAAFAQGYVMAHDRLPQMDVLRRAGAGTLAELYGEQDPSLIDADLEIRMHRIVALAGQSWTMLQASPDDVDRQLVELLQRFSDGVNAYAISLARGEWTLDPAVAASFAPAAFVAWTPVDSLVIARFQALSASWTAPFELDATELYQKLRATYDDAPPGNAAFVARRGISRDLFKLTPVGTQPTIDGFPNVTVDTGSRADGSGPLAAAASATAAPGAAADAAPAADPARPVVPQALLDSARDALSGAFGARFAGRFAGSNSWVVGAERAGGVHVLLAADQHVPLGNPSLYYPTHLIVQPLDGEDVEIDPGALPAVTLDLIGVTIPGIPGIVLGSNGNVAWSTTTAEHDVNDLYLEHIAPCPTGGGDCAAWTDAQGVARSVRLQSFTEDIRVGTRGAIRSSLRATYEVAPHHGPILPVIDRAQHALIPRSAATAISVRHAGDQPSFELRALYRLALAGDVHAAFAALRDIRQGGQNWTIIDNHQHIGWTAQAFVPVRKPAAMAWDPLVRQDSLAPFFVLPGDGGGDWIDGEALLPRYIPHAVDPPQGYLVTANADPVGATFDGLPLNQRAADGDLYAGVAYAAGLREDRITALVQQAAAAPRGVSLDDMARIQRDTRSSVGERLAPAIRTALARVDSPLGSPADLAPYVAALSPADRDRLAAARGLLDAWTFATPAATDGPDPDSAATALFHTWMHFFLSRTLADELAAVGFDLWRLDDDRLVRIVHAVLNDPGSLVNSPATQQPILCDDIATPGDTSCTVQILAAMIDAMTHLASPQGFGTTDTAAWRWGALHRLTIPPLSPDAALALPAPGELATAGFPRAGDGFAINRAGHGWSTLDFSQRSDGAAQRFIAEARPGAPIAIRWALPGGAIFDRRSPHYRDLLDRYYLTGELFDAPIAIADIVAAGELRWVFR